MILIRKCGHFQRQTFQALIDTGLGILSTYRNDTCIFWREYTCIPAVFYTSWYDCTVVVLMGVDNDDVIMM